MSMMDPAVAGPVVLATLREASSQDTTRLKLAESQLKDWETQAGFYSVLQAIFADHSVDADVRFLAVVCFKNGIDRYWRRNAPNGLLEEEKSFLRQKLISQFNEPLSQIATQEAILIAKIARLDCPRQWPDLLPVLLETIKSENTFEQQRALLTLHHVVKALASKRLATDRLAFEEFSSNVFYLILSLWDGHTNYFLQAIQTNNLQAACTSLDHATLALKVLRKLAVFGLKTLENNEVVNNFIKLVFQRIEEFLKLKQAIVGSQQLLQKREKVITLLSKVLLDVLEHHPEAYIPFITASLQLCVTYNFTDQGRDLIYERFTINSFNLMRSILRAEMYRPPKKLEDTKNPKTLEAFQIKQDFFSSQMLRDICCCLIGQYLPLTQNDLQSWDSDPEDYLTDEGGDTWKFSIRPCVESLYQTLMKEFRSTLTPVVVELLQQQLGEIDPDNIQAVLKKDAVYNAIGLSSFDLFDDIDFDSWFQSHLIPELQNKHSNYRILRRRVVWLIGCWVGVKFSSDLQPQLYNVLLPLLLPQEDLVVRMEAAYTLRIVVDDFEFKSEYFVNFLESGFGSLFQLLKDVEECETKMQILHVMSFIIERMGLGIRPHVGALVHYLPLLWAESADHNMLRCAILGTLTCLVQGLGPLCTSLFDFLLPIIQLSTDMSQDPHVYLCEDGLDLWYNTLLCTPSITPQLLNIYTNMSALLEFGSETLKTCLKTIEAYIILAPTEFLQKYSDVLVKDMTSLLSDLKTEGAVMVYKVIELVFKVAPLEGPRMFSSMLPGLVRAFVESNDYPMVTSMYIALLSRMVVGSEAYFWELIQQLAQELQQQAGDILGALLDTWLDKVDNLIQPDRKKLSTMALVQLLKANNSVVLERIGGIINTCVETIHDVYRLDPDQGINQLPDCLVINQVESPPDEEETEHDRRKLKLSAVDPVHTVSLGSFVSSQLQVVQHQQGDENFARLTELIDPDILKQLQTLLK